MDKNFLERLLQTFRIEADEHITNISSCLLRLEQDGSESLSEEAAQRVLEEVYREAHSLKGAARAVGIARIETVCQRLEDMFSAVRKGETVFSPNYFDTAHRANDLIRMFLQSDDEVKKSQISESIQQTVDSISELLQQKKPGRQAHQAPARPAKLSAEPPASYTQAPEGTYSTLHSLVPSDADAARSADHTLAQSAAEKLSIPAASMRSSGTVRIETGRLETLMTQAEEMTGARLRMNFLYSQLNELDIQIDSLVGKGSNLAQAGNFRFSHLAKDYLSLVDDMKGLRQSLQMLIKSTRTGNHELSLQTENLLETVKQMTMLPFSHVLELMPKLVRDLGRDLSRDVILEIQGQEIQADRRILEEIKSPLIHLIRNCIDHGIEPAADRVRKGKPEKGLIRIVVSRPASSSIEITVEDDGRGIDSAKVAAAARANSSTAAATSQNLMPPALCTEPLQDELLDMISAPGISTAETVTEVSGRGLGMSIVRDTVEALGGKLSLNTRAGEGTIFRITLPLTLSTFRGVVVRVSDRLFAFPASAVEHILRVGYDSIKTVNGRQTILAGNTPVVLASLQSLLALENMHRDENFATAAVISVSNRRIAIAVDEVLYEQELLLKPFGKQISRLKNISGAAIQGDGKIVPVLNPSDLIRAAENAGPADALNPGRHAAAALSPHGNLHEDKRTDKKILVADDSITSRLLIKDIVESAGYNVKTAVDGSEAFTMLGLESFDLVVSDVEMPYMNGFELSSAIRRDENLKDTPVILVTALSKPEDKEKGIASGANAYIVKGTFEQSDLLNTIARLI